MEFQWTLLQNNCWHIHDKKKKITTKKSVQLQSNFFCSKYQKKRERINNGWQVTCQKKKDKNDLLLWWPVQFVVLNIKKRTVRIKVSFRTGYHISSRTKSIISQVRVANTCFCKVSSSKPWYHTKASITFRKLWSLWFFELY